MPTLAEETMAIALSMVDQNMETGGPNRGPVVDQIHEYAGRPPEAADSWCAQYVWWCIGHAAANLGVKADFNPSSSVQTMWDTNTHLRVDGPPQAGDVFCLHHADGGHHCGLVRDSQNFGDGLINTNEGNTNAGGSREGTGVFNRTRGVQEINMGYLRPIAMTP